MRLNSLLFAVVLASAFTACGGDDDDGPSDAASGKGGSAGTSGKGGSGGSSQAGETNGGEGGETATAPSSASKKISADDGGEVELGDAALSIPAGALASDTTVTVEAAPPSDDLPDASTLKGLLYDFGPDGTTFETPVALTLPSVGKPGADEEAVIAWLDEDKGEWQDLATTVNDDGTLTAEITHFTTFVVRFNGVEQSDCGFSACGGDVVGTWKVTGLCAKAEMALEELCPTAVATFDVQVSGSATFESDGTRSTDFTTKVDISYTLDADCLDAATGGNVPASCDDLSKPAQPDDDKGPTTCTGDPSEACTCVEEGIEKTEHKSGQYTIDGSKMTTIDDDDGSEEVLDFCVEGGEGRFQQQADKAVITWIAQKQ